MPSIYDPMDWAASAPAEDTPTRPSDAEIAAGWSANEPIDQKTVNWFWAMVGQLSQVASTFSTLEALCAGLAAGQSAVLREDSLGANLPGGVDGFGDPGFNFVSIDTDGINIVCITSGGAGKKYARALSSGAISATDTFSPSNGPVTAARRVLYDGTQCVICYDDWIECFDPDGTVRWEYQHAGQVYDIAMDGNAVYFVGADASSIACGAIALSSSGTATATWTYDHGADAYSVATDGNKVYLAGAAGTGGYTLRAISASTGLGTGLGAWTSTQATPADAPRCLSTDGRVLVCGLPTAAAHQVEARSCGDGSVISQAVLLDFAGAPIGPSSVALDARYVAVSLTDGAGSAPDGGVRLLDRASLAHAHDATVLDTTAQRYGFEQVVSDGQAFFATGLGDGFTGGAGARKNVCRFFRGGYQRRWTKVAASARYLPLRQQAVPSDS